MRTRQLCDQRVLHERPARRSIDKALLTLPGQLFGEFLLTLAELGLIIFGIHGLREARWPRV